MKLARYDYADDSGLLKNIRARSIYHHPDIEVAASNKILTLPTTIYKYSPYEQNDPQASIVLPG